MYRLISATPSPYARKVRIALAEKGLPFEFVTEVPWNRDSITPRYNPLEKLPVLITDAGETYYDSRFILEFLELAHPDPALLPPDRTGHLKAKRLEVLADGVCDALILVLMERLRLPAMQSAQWQARQLRKVEGGLAEIDRLVAGGSFAVGQHFGLGDIAAGTVAGYMSVRFPEIDWRARHGALAALSARLEERPSFKASVPTPQVIRDRVA